MRIPEGPVWPKTAKGKKPYSPLKKDIQTDILVVGGGITGVQTAYLLAKHKKKVVLIEKDEIGEGATEYTTAFITSAFDSGLVEIKDIFSARIAHMVWESHQKAIDSFEKIIKDEKISCEFTRCSCFQYAATRDEIDGLKEEAQLAGKLGINMMFHEKNKLGFRNFGYIEMLRQAKFHPLSYLFQLTKKAKEKGVLIYEKTEALDIQEEKEKLTINTTNGIITANFVIEATHAPFQEPLSFKLKKGMYTTYMLYVEIPKNALLEAIYEDTLNPYNYFRVDKGKKHDYLLIGGQDHREEINMDPKKNFHALEDYLNRIMPFKYKVIRRWTGPILEPSDGLPYIGRLEKGKNILVATGFSGTGMTYSMIAAQILRDLVLGRKNKYEKLYNATRIPTPKQLMQKGADYTQEFLGGAVKNTFSTK